MKRLLLVALVATSFSGLANANNGVYASLKTGISDTKLKSNEVNYNVNGGAGSETHRIANQTRSTYPNIAVAVGYDFSLISPVNARAELEYTYKDKTKFDADASSITTFNSYDENVPTPYTNTVRTQSLMLNGYYDFKNQSKFTPYVSAGVGITRIKNNLKNTNYPDDEYSLSKSDNHFTWSTGLGIAYNISQNVALDASYRYVDAGKFEFKHTHSSSEDTSVKFKQTSNDYALGIRYNF